MNVWIVPKKDEQNEQFADEIGTIPKIESMEMMFSAGRSRRISMVPIIQSFAQLQKNYGKEGSSIIIDNCQDILFGGFAPNSESVDIILAGVILFWLNPRFFNDGPY